MHKIITNSEKETFIFAEKLAKKFNNNEIIGLIGELGAGKTVFARGIASGLGVRDNVNSPTFVIMKIYNAKFKKIKYFCHIDAYRLNNAKDLESIGAEEYFNRQDTISVIEWADKIKKVLPKKIKLININQSENKRIIKIN